jgi:hypothetical protein
MQPSKLTAGLTLLTYVREVLGSNFDRDLDYPDRIFVLFPSHYGQMKRQIGHDCLRSHLLQFIAPNILQPDTIGDSDTYSYHML